MQDCQFHACKKHWTLAFTQPFGPNMAHGFQTKLLRCKCMWKKTQTILPPPLKAHTAGCVPQCHSFSSLYTKTMQSALKSGLRWMQDSVNLRMRLGPAQSHPWGKGNIIWFCSKDLSSPSEPGTKQHQGKCRLLSPITMKITHKCSCLKKKKKHLRKNVWGLDVEV